MGQIRPVELRLLDSGPSKTSFRNRCEWVRRGAEPPLEDERVITVAMTADS
jgi:hypothetical protein